MMPVLTLGPLSLNFPLLILVLGLWLGLFLTEKRFVTEGVDPSKLIDALMTVMIGMVIGARVAYLLRYPSIFLAAPAGIFSISTDLLDPWGAVVVGLVLVIRYLQRENIAFWTFLEAVMPLGLVLAIAFALMSFAATKGYGTQTDLPWAVMQAGAMRHPYQLYFVLLMAGVFGTFVWLKKQAVASEQLVGLCVFMLGFALVLGFGFQADANRIFNGLRVSQLLGVGAMVFGMWGFLRTQAPE